MYEIALIANIIIGIINFNRASKFYKQEDFNQGDLSFLCGMTNCMLGISMIAYGVYRVLVA